VGFFLFLSCSPADRQAADRLNSLSYAYHYSSLDSTEHYAQQVMRMSALCADGKAEALNNLAFVRIAQMRYEEAEQLLSQIPDITDNQIELLVSYIQQMRLCQRRSHNRDFYDYRELANNALRRINEERATLDERQLARIVYAESEMAIVTSTYFYYVGLERQASQALEPMPAELERDTAQFLNYLYNVGAGGIITQGTQEDINQAEFDYLMRCFLLSQQSGIRYFEANSLEALAEHLIVAEFREQIVADNLPAMKFLAKPSGIAERIHSDDIPYDSLALYLAQASLDIFTDYGDVYQIAGAHRTLASCYLAHNDYGHALEELHLALGDTIINQAPDLVASIHEQLSVAYAAIDDKQHSDQHRNTYLDLQEQTRQDRSLEARAGQLEQASQQLTVLIWAVVGAIVFLFLLLLLFFLRHRHRTAYKEDLAMQQQEDELNEQLAMARLRVEKGERLALEQRARVSLVNGITPLIDRIIHEVSRLEQRPTQERLDYISELTDNINEQTRVLTHWIQLRQGELSLHIETFALQPLFDIVAMGRRSFAMKGIDLQVEPTAAKVKADKVLTLFMLNTLADNARKFTPQGGCVSIRATEGDDYVELSVKDTGVGMTEEQLAHVFDRKVIVDENTQVSSLKSQSSHGFGLLNCKGIIEKYRKLSQIFSVCQLSAESRIGEGSRFFFRLPKGMVRSVVLFLMMTGVGNVTLADADVSPHLSAASAYADSAYFSNVSGSYWRTICFADSCRRELNAFYRQQHPNGTDTLCLLGDASLTPPEIIWLHNGTQLNYDILLTIRNESSVAALALHQWQLYHYNNRIYTLLFKELSSDATLDDYCRKMQQSQANKQVAIILLVLLFLIILMAVAWQVISALGKAARRRQEQQEQMEMTSDEIVRTEQEEAALHVSNAVLDNCLSALKHETMYYPSRIRQLIDSSNTEALPEVVAYYRELYGLLSLQATRQTEPTRLHLTRLSHDILGDAVLVDYLFELLRKQSGQKKLDVSYTSRPDGKYVDCTVSMPALHLDEHQAATLFTASAVENIPYLLCRQIVRDHGEATNRRACAIRAEVSKSGITTIVITLPRVNKSL
jgi:signal transduction histidine kinase